MTDATHAAPGHQAHAENHPGPATYAKIAAVLVAITAVEFIVYYVQSLHVVLVPVLLVLSSIKFALVAMFYMHLKFDNGVYTRLLVAGIIIGAGVVLSLMVLFYYSHPLMQAVS